MGTLMLYVDIWFLTSSETLNNLKGDIDIYNEKETLRMM